MKYVVAFAVMAAFGLTLCNTTDITSADRAQLEQRKAQVYARCIRAQPFTPGFERCREEVNAIRFG